MIHVSKNSILSAGALLLLSGALLFWRFQRSGAQADCFTVEHAYQKWAEGTGDREELEKQLSRLPELHAKYDARIAQRLLERGMQVVGATPQPANHYGQFAEVSLLIGAGALDQALEKSRLLKQEMAATPSLLHGYLLLRIAMLEQEVGTPQGELAAWNELLESPSLRLLSLSEGNLHLTDYIRHRRYTIPFDTDTGSSFDFRTSS